MTKKHTGRDFIIKFHFKIIFYTVDAYTSSLYEIFIQ